jgi:hypothetical protein
VPVAHVHSCAKQPFVDCSSRYVLNDTILDPLCIILAMDAAVSSLMLGAIFLK